MRFCRPVLVSRALAVAAIPVLLAAQCPRTGYIAIELGGCPEAAVEPGAAFTLQATVTDADGGDITSLFVFDYQASGGPGIPTIVIDAASATITLPGDAPEGAYEIEASAVGRDDPGLAYAWCRFDVVEACDCETSADCDDGDRCNGDEVCEACACVAGRPLDCSDGLDCTDDGCDALDGCNHASNCPAATPLCVEGGAGGVCLECQLRADCDPGQQCRDNICVPEGCQSDADCAEQEKCLKNLCVPEDFCQADADCDDGRFCNGLETCDVQQGTCLPGDPPCDLIFQSCNEEVDVCEDVGGVPICTLTVGVDECLGTGMDDVFRAVVAREGSTLNPGDHLDGGAAYDTLLVTLVDVDYSPVATITRIERLMVLNADPGVAHRFAMAGIDDAREVWTDRSLAPLAFTGIDHLVALGVHDTEQDLAATFQNAALAGDDDVLEVLLERTRSTNHEGVDLVIGSDGADGVEHLEIRTLGGQAEVLNAIRDDGENDLQTLTLLNVDPLRIRHIDASVEFIDGSGAEAALDLTLPDNDVEVIGGPGDDVFAASDGGHVLSVAGGEGADHISGGDGDDFLEGGAGADVIDGGSGSDTCIMSAAHASSADADRLVFEPGAGGDVLSLERAALCGSGVPTLSAASFAKGAPALAADDTFLVLTDRAYTSFQDVEDSIQAASGGTSSYVVCFLRAAGLAQCWADDDSAVAGGCRLATLESIAALSELDLLIQANFDTF